MSTTPPDLRAPRSKPASPARARTCVGCAEKAAPLDLVRVVLAPAPRAEPLPAPGAEPREPGPAAGGPEPAPGASAGGKRAPERRSATVVVDAAGGAFGRGAHVHPRPECIARACRGGFSRAFKTDVRADAAGVAAAVAEAFGRRFGGLLVTGRGAGALAVGADAATEALEQGAPLVVVACDAESIVRRGPIARAIAEGRAVAWGAKKELGALLGRDEVAVVAVTKSSIASELQRVARIADAVTTSDLRASSEAPPSKSFRGVAWCPEVR